MRRQILYGGYFGRERVWSEHTDGGTSRYDKNGVMYQTTMRLVSVFKGSDYPPVDRLSYHR